MRRVLFEQFGEPAEVLRLEETEQPRPAKGEVRVKMEAAAVNPSDLMLVRGVYGGRCEFPATPGFEGVGVVEESGGGLLANMIKGKRVAVSVRGGGTWAEQAIVSAKQAVPVKDMPREHAATFFVNPATAYVLTRRVLAVPKREWLAQTAAGSTLGKMVIRLGKTFGFKTLNLVRREEQIDELKSLGADVVALEQNAAGAIEDATQGNGIKYAIDPVGGPIGSTLADALAEGGRLIAYGDLAKGRTSFSPRSLLMQSARIEGFWLGPWMQSQSLLGRLGVVKKVRKLINQGPLAADVGESFPLDRFAEAIQKAESPARGGKVLLVLE